MHHSLLAVFVIVTMTSCISYYTPTPIREPMTVVVQKDTLQVYAIVKDRVGKPKGTMVTQGYGMNLNTYSHILENSAWYFAVLRGSDTVWVKYGDVLSPDAHAAKKIGIERQITVPVSMSEDVWSRMTVWINKNSSTKIQNMSDNLIDTYNPITSGKYGYTATRLKNRDSVTIELQCKYKPYGYTDVGGGDCKERVRAGLYFALTGADDFTGWFDY